jgi:hypothetical protein
MTQPHICTQFNISFISVVLITCYVTIIIMVNPVYIACVRQIEYHCVRYIVHCICCMKSYRSATSIWCVDYIIDINTQLSAHVSNSCHESGMPMDLTTSKFDIHRALSWLMYVVFASQFYHIHTYVVYVRSCPIYWDLSLLHSRHLLLDMLLLLCPVVTSNYVHGFIIALHNKVGAIALAEEFVAHGYPKA